MTTPITPKQLKADRTFPDFVIDAFNACIQKNFNGRSATFRQDEVVEEIVKRGGVNVTRAMVFEEHYLDVEDVYRKHGWDVYFDKPGWNESYDAYFRFTVREQRGE